MTSASVRRARDGPQKSVPSFHLSAVTTPGSFGAFRSCQSFIEDRSTWPFPVIALGGSGALGSHWAGWFRSLALSSRSAVIQTMYESLTSTAQSSEIR